MCLLNTFNVIETLFQGRVVLWYWGEGGGGGGGGGVWQVKAIMNMLRERKKKKAREIKW